MNPLASSVSALFLGAGLLLSSTPAQAGQVSIHNFDDPAQAALWTWENWSDPAEAAYDDQRDAGGGGAPGSMRVTCNFPDKPGGYSQAVVTLNLGGDVDAETLYRAIEFDVKLDPASYPRVDGTNYGALEMIFRNGPDWTWNSLGGVQLTAAHTNWTRLSYPVKTPGDKVHHLTLKLGENNLTNTVIYNIDNVRWIESAAVIPPPTMAIGPSRAGLNLTAASPGRYDRQNIKTVGGTYGWIGSAVPVSFAVTVADFPNPAAYAGFQTHLYLVPGSPGTESAPDWTEPTVVLIGIAANADGSAAMTFRYKTNAPNSNGPVPGGYFNSDPAAGFAGTLGSVTSSNMIGTWTVTFEKDTQITLQGPDGATRVVTMPAADAAQFGGDIAAYFGVMPGQPEYIGQSAVLSRVKIASGQAALLDEAFQASPLNPDRWEVRADSPGGVVPVMPADRVWVSWTTPASGFILQTNATLNPAAWGDAGLADTLVGTRKRVLIPGASMPGATQGFFRLAKPSTP
jgi:hypothetical protein